MKAILLFWMICLGLHIAPASAQSEADWNVILREAMLQEIVDTAALNNDPGTARQGYDKCLDISKRLAARTDVLALQRLFLEAMISRCISHAMFNGQFSDDTGDACAHEYGGATKLVQALAEARNGLSSARPCTRSPTRSTRLSARERQWTASRTSSR